MACMHAGQAPMRRTHLEHATRLLVDEAADALDATAASQPADGRLRNALDVVPQDFAVALCAALAQALAALAASRHVAEVVGMEGREEEGLCVLPVARAYL